jgi:hypothetical protein
MCRVQTVRGCEQAMSEVSHCVLRAVLLAQARGRPFPFESVSRAREIGQSVANRSVGPKRENPAYGVVAVSSGLVSD